MIYEIDKDLGGYYLISPASYLFKTIVTYKFVTDRFFKDEIYCFLKLYSFDFHYFLGSCLVPVVQIILCVLSNLKQNRVSLIFIFIFECYA